MTQGRVYRIQFQRDAEREIALLPARDRLRVAARINTFADDPRPRGAKKLAGIDDLYRIRVGDYRVVYQVQDRVLLVVVVHIGHRRQVYRR